MVQVHGALSSMQGLRTEDPEEGMKGNTHPFPFWTPFHLKASRSRRSKAEVELATEAPLGRAFGRGEKAELGFEGRC